MVKTALNSDMKLKMLKKRFEADSEKMGLLDSYLFVTHYRAFNDQLTLMDKLKKEVDELGLMVVVPVGQNAKTVVNPAVGEYNKMAGLATKTGAALIAMIEAKKKEIASVATEIEDDPL